MYYVDFDPQQIVTSVSPQKQNAISVEIQMNLVFQFEEGIENFYQLACSITQRRILIPNKTG